MLPRVQEGEVDVFDAVATDGLRHLTVWEAIAQHLCRSPVVFSGSDTLTTALTKVF